jgi:GNAT superfamily N-acetyltransferase
VAEHEGTALLSALLVAPERRRAGAGGLLLRAAAHWAAAQGAARLALFVERGNAAANALYASAGMRIVEGYHYRRAPDRPEAP